MVTIEDIEIKQYQGGISIPSKVDVNKLLEYLKALEAKVRNLEQRVEDYENYFKL